MVAALDQNAVVRGAADPGEKGERNGDDKRAGTGNDKEVQRAVKKYRECTKPQQRRKHRKQRGENNDHRRIDACEAGDKFFAFRFVFLCMFNERKDLAGAVFAERRRHAQQQRTAQIHAAGLYRIADTDLLRQGFAGQCGGIERRTAAFHPPVQRNALTGMDFDQVADAHLGGMDFPDVAVFKEVRGVRADIHQRTNGVARGIDRFILQKFAELKEEHDRRSLPVFADADRSDAGERHEKRFVKQFAVHKVFHGFLQYAEAGGKIGGKKKRDTHCAPAQHAEKEQDHRGSKPYKTGGTAFLLPAVSVLVRAAGAAPVIMMFVFMRMRHRTLSPPFLP